jgi:hypothetical protein
MKNLKSTLVIMMLATLFTTSFAQKNLRVLEDNEIRNKVTNLMANFNTNEVGCSDITFKLVNNRIQVITTTGKNQLLNKQIKSKLESSKINFKGEYCFYQVNISVVGAHAKVYAEDKALQDLRTLISKVLSASKIQKTGMATIKFRINQENALVVTAVNSSDKSLSASVKNIMDRADLLAPQGLAGNYEVNVRF